MNLLYFYSDYCGSCKGYSDEVDKLATAINLKAEKQNISEIEPLYELKGIPTIILTDDDGKELWRSIGNIPAEHLITDVKKLMK